MQWNGYREFALGVRCLGREETEDIGQTAGSECADSAIFVPERLAVNKFFGDLVERLLVDSLLVEFL